MQSKIHSAAADKNVSQFLSKLAQRLKGFEATEERNNRKTAENFSPFRYIRLDENMTSAILADLLNPKGAHGQGRLFLNSFLVTCGLSSTFFPHGTEVRVATEAATYGITQSSRRMDIFLSGGGNCLAVENKIGAADQETQVADYLCHLKQTTSGCFTLVYLTPDGSAPSEHSLPKSIRNIYAENIHMLSWVDLLECLSECRKEIDAEKLRFFLRDFINALNAFIG